MVDIRLNELMGCMVHDINCLVLLFADEGNVAEVFHKGIRFPTKKFLNGEGVGAGGVKENASSYTDGVGGVFDIALGVEVIELGCNHMHNFADDGIVDVHDGGAVLINGKW